MKIIPIGQEGVEEHHIMHLRFDKTKKVMLNPIKQIYTATYISYS